MKTLKGALGIDPKKKAPQQYEWVGPGQYRSASGAIVNSRTNPGNMQPPAMGKALGQPLPSAPANPNMPRTGGGLHYDGAQRPMPPQSQMPQQNGTPQELIGMQEQMRQQAQGFADIAGQFATPAQGMGQQFGQPQHLIGQIPPGQNMGQAVGNMMGGQPQNPIGQQSTMQQPMPQFGQQQGSGRLGNMAPQPTYGPGSGRLGNMGPGQAMGQAAGAPIQPGIRYGAQMARQPAKMISDMSVAQRNPNFLQRR